MKDELKKVEYLKLKAILISEDGGQTWFIEKQFYLAGSQSEYEESKFLDVNLEGEYFESK